MVGERHILFLSAGEHVMVKQGRDRFTDDHYACSRRAVAGETRRYSAARKCICGHYDIYIAQSFNKPPREHCNERDVPPILKDQDRQKVVTSSQGI